MEKVFVLDTSVLMHDPYHILNNFEDNIIVIPIWVIEELDHLKSRQDKGWQARAISNQLDDIREIGSLKEGVKIPTGGMVFVDYEKCDPTGLDLKLEDTNDNRILFTAKLWQEKQKSKKVIFVSKDTNLRIKADALGIDAQDYQKDKSIQKFDDLYSGLKEIAVSEKKIIDTIQRDGNVNAALIPSDEIFPNQCCRLAHEDKYALALFKKSEEAFRRVTKVGRHSSDNKHGKQKIHPKNMEQAFAYALLTDPSINLITLVGKAGTGKTLISLLAGYSQLSSRYKQMVIYRPHVELGSPLGLLPGSIEEKFEPWTRPILDNLNLILEERYDDDEFIDKAIVTSPAQEMIRTGLIEIAPITYLRGRSLHNKFVIIDEVQNLTPHEIKSIITRAGDSSKFVLTGDPTQIDNPYVDSVSNGLSYVVERFKGQEMFGHIKMVKGERSPLSELAASLL